MTSVISTSVLGHTGLVCDSSIIKITVLAYSALAAQHGNRLVSRSHLCDDAKLLIWIAHAEANKLKLHTEKLCAQLF